jgi:hypothetical protein
MTGSPAGRSGGAAPSDAVATIAGSATAAQLATRRRGTAYSDDSIPLEVALDAPDLLRAFVPYAHAQSGIRDEPTSRTLAMVDALRSSYKREVLRQAKYWGLDDAV